MGNYFCKRIRNVDSNGRHFVLVHGSCHGAWCWYKVATKLISAGHRVTSLDLAASGTNPKQVDDIHSLTDYLEPLISFMEALPLKENIILVGHSKGGIAISVATEMFPHKISVGVYVTAYMPGPDLTLVDINRQLNPNDDDDNDSIVIYDEHNHEISFLFGPKWLASHIYQLSPPEDLTLAIYLTRPYPNYDDERSLKETTFTKKNYGSVQRVYIVSGQDISIPVSVQRWMIESNPPDEVKVISGSDHMVMMSKPQQLFLYLQAIAKKYN